MLHRGLHLLLAPGGTAREMGRSVGDQAAQGVGESLGKGFEMIAVIAVGIIVLIALAVVLLIVAAVRAYRRSHAPSAPAAPQPTDHA